MHVATLQTEITPLLTINIPIKSIMNTKKAAEELPKILEKCKNVSDYCIRDSTS